MALQGNGRALRRGLLRAADSWRCLAASRAASSTPHADVDERIVANLPPEKRRALVNMMLYRAKQRGFLELDLLMGKYAEKTIPKMSDHKLLAFNALLLEENPDLFKWLTGQLPPPPEIANNEAFKDLRGTIASQVAVNSNTAAIADTGQEWVRGWSDAGTDMSK
mmetsp:Transcript_16924/g.42911  ORF Transcript_16924/g.42911 Transcript_16924/m.42911 type:complete len:165 (-) Transcript_16924:224-718(-)